MIFEPTPPTLRQLLTGALWLIALCGIGSWFGRLSDSSTNPIFIIASAGCFLAASLAIIRPLYWLLTWPILRFIDRLFIPVGSTDRPPFDLTVAHHCREKERYDDALNEYERLRDLHPKRPEPYDEALDILREHYEDTEELITELSKLRRRHIR